jgi:hypothetical protein
MTIRFAAADREDHSVRHVLSGALPLKAANDNIPGIANDKLLRAALRHFATHGLGAAEAARVNAERAFFAGDRTEYRWWLGICRMLDRRMAETVAAHREAANLR